MSTFLVSLAIAAHVWGPAPCGTPQVEWVTPIAAQVQAQDQDPTGAAITTVPYAPYPGWPADLPACSIVLNTSALGADSWHGRDRWFLRRRRAMICTAIVHEDGHITGHQHSADPDNVMYARPDRPYWRCARRFMGVAR